MQPGYLVQFTERLGYSPYPGTLNVQVPPSDLPRVTAVKDWRGIRIDGFTASGRTFGGATCFVARLGGRPCHLIVPDRTHHKEVVEFIAAEFLRESLAVKDGDQVDVLLEDSKCRPPSPEPWPRSGGRRRLPPRPPPGTSTSGGRRRRWGWSRSPRS
jgi:riboflavin kinase